MARHFRTGGLAAWSIRRPIAVTMLALTVVAPGLLSLEQLGIELLPHLIYPNVRVRVLDGGVPAIIMEDQVTRQLEEQLAITEGAIAVESHTRAGRSAVNLAFAYGTDIDGALRDASSRLDRAKRFLPNTIDPPVIFKSDPSNAPVMEFVISSDRRDPVGLYNWVDYSFSKSLINVPGVASVEVGGGLVREIAVEVDQERLAATGLTVTDIANLLAAENQDATGGRLMMSNRELSTRVAGRFRDTADLTRLNLSANQDDSSESDGTLRLGDIAEIHNTHGTEQLRIRLDGIPGVKLSIQKQPQTNTVAVVDGVLQRIEWMRISTSFPPTSRSIK